jgi:Uncharacterised protein family (UPF0236)
VNCPGCQHPAEFKDYRKKTATSVLGTIHFRRGYYHCRRCGCGLFPFDQETGLGLHRLTPGAERLVSLLGLTADSFEEAAKKLLPEACGLHLGESTVQSVTEDAGARLGKLHEQGCTLGESKPFEWHKDASGKTCAYVGTDLTGVPQQAADGGPAEGRMPYVGVVFNPVPDPPAKQAEAKKPEPLPTPGYEPVAETAAPRVALPQAAAEPARAKRPRMQARYVAGLMSLAALGLLMRKQAAQVGMENAERWIALSDGGSGLENFLRSNFNRADLVVILDFWHAANYLETLARAMYPEDEEKRTGQAQAWCHTMKHEAGAAILKVLKELQLPRSKAVREAHQEAVQYIGNNVHRMNYPSYLKQGWHIGSGAIESACKTVVGQRLKLAGMRWREYGTDNVCHLRALLKSEKDQWAAFWERKVNRKLN